MGVVSVRRLVGVACAAVCLVAAQPEARAGFVVFEAAGVDAASITPTRDALRTAIGGGTVAGANGSFGGVRREINWDGVPAGSADPNGLAGNFFNVTSPRGVVFSTPGTGFLVSANSGGATPTLFGFSNDFRAFSAEKVFTAVGSNIVDISFFLPGTGIAATTSAFGAVFTDVEVADLTKIEFFDASDTLIFSRSVLASSNQGFSILGAVAGAGEEIARVRITSGLNTIVSNGVLGNPNDDVVVMDDFLFAEPVGDAAVPEPASLAVLGLGLLGLGLARRRRGAVAAG